VSGTFRSGRPFNRVPVRLPNGLSAFAAASLVVFALGVAPASAQPRPAAGERPNEADVRFMQHMIPHHSQALEMTALVQERTTSRDVRALALRIEISQHDEIAWMTRWLEDRGAAASDPHAGHHAPMPGMLTPAELAALAAASGPAFDRLFLESMIRHHEGALVMVGELLAAEGAAHGSEVYRFATEVDGDQRADISRMRGMLAEMP
jgi:uncharacterized protein (DUF305 family)